MNRVDYLKAQRISTTEWRLDFHSAKYNGLRNKSFTTIPYTITMAEENRPDLLSLKVYGKPELWWVLCQFNGILNPLTELVVGKVISVPDFSEVDTFFKGDTTRTRAGTFVEV